MQFCFFYNSFLGNLQICSTTKGICAIKFVSECETYLSDYQHPYLKAAKYYLDAFFAKKNPKCTFPLDLNGTPFQHKVWNALLQIPFGETRTYQQIAIAIGNPKAARAVGMANHRNPIPIVIPCHRVIGSNVELVGYADGLELKQKLLDFECNS